MAWSSGAFTVPGWTSLILSVWFLAGLILAVLGVHGVYVGRIFAEVQNRPRLLVEATTDSAPVRAPTVNVVGPRSSR
jgi:dolichol-phosphate mannosyltransferase